MINYVAKPLLTDDGSYMYQFCANDSEVAIFQTSYEAAAYAPLHANGRSYEFKIVPNRKQVKVIGILDSDLFEVVYQKENGELVTGQATGEEIKNLRQDYSIRE